MTAEEHQRLFAQLSQAKRRKQFVPFSIDLRDGRSLEVEDRWHVGFADGNPVIVVHSTRLGHHVAFKWDDVAAIRQHEPAA